MGRFANERGDKSREWNRHVVSSDWFHRNMARSQQGGGLVGGSDSNTVIVRNNSGADRRRGDILEFTGLDLSDLSDDLPWMIGGSPTLANAFCVLLHDLPSAAPDNYGRGSAHGVVKAYVNITNTAHRYAAPAASNYVLQSAAIGPVRIMWQPGSTGEQTCLVLLNGVTGEILVRNDSGGNYAANGGPRTYSMITGTPGSYTTVGTISAYNVPAFNNGKVGAASLLEGVPYAAPWEQ